MSLTHTPSRRLFASLSAVILLSAAAAAQTAAPPQQDFSQVRIKNFGQMDGRFYRGAEPKKVADFEALKALGIQTVIDLQAEPEPEERGRVEALGMRYVHIPMVEKKYPTPESVVAFMKAVDDPSTGAFFVHCAGGRHRTGAMGAVYRYEKYGWGYEQVYAEMKKFDFYTSWGHGAFKDFVKDYFQQVQSRAAQPAAAAAPPAEAVFAGNKN